MEKVLITGITGQDGLFLTKLLLEKKEDISIVGVSRKNNTKAYLSKLKNIYKGEVKNIKLVNTDMFNENEVKNLLTSFRPDFVYNLMGPSSVYESLSDKKNKELITQSFNFITEALIENRNFCNFFQASSSEMFRGSNNKLSEVSPMDPRSPYAEAKLINHNKIESFHRNYDWKIKSGIMFNHESEFRPNKYLFMKIINKAIEIDKQRKGFLRVGSVDYIRDWSFAGDLVNAMYLVNTKGQDYSYVIGSGIGTSVKAVIKYVFEYMDLDWNRYVKVDKELLRTGDPNQIVSNPEKINKELNWEVNVSVEELLDRCIKSRIN